MVRRGSIGAGVRTLTELKKKDCWLTQAQMAASIGIRAETFQLWHVKPVARIGRYTYYSVKDVLENRKQREDELAERKGDQSELDFEKLRLTRAQADGQEIKNEIARGKTVPIEIIQIVLSRIAGEAAGELDSIPLNVKRKHPQLDGQVIDDIKRQCVKAQNAIARCDEILDAVLNDYIADSDTIS